MADGPGDAAKRATEIVCGVRAGVVSGNDDVEVHDHPDSNLCDEEHRNPERHSPEGREIRRDGRRGLGRTLSHPTGV
jgi:hypothetical protein